MFCTTFKLIGKPTFSNPLISITRSASDSTNANLSDLAFKSKINNRNPRNLERMTIARKPTGFHLDSTKREFWHKLEIIKKNRYIVGRVVHNDGTVAISASSNEFGISKHLYRTNDVSAYLNVARVLAQRCFESGIQRMTVDQNTFLGEKEKLFVEEVQKEGVTLDEPERYRQLTPWNRYVMVKPWKVHE